MLSEEDIDELQAELLDAALKGSARRIRQVVAQGASFNRGGIDPLATAAGKGHTRAIETLLELGATIEGELPNNDAGQTALHCAAEKGHTASIRILLAADGKKFMNHFDGDLGWTPLHYAVNGRQLKAAAALLDGGADVNANDLWVIGFTPLDMAATNRDAAMVELLLSRGADPDIPTWMQITARMRAEGTSAEIRSLFQGR